MRARRWLHVGLLLLIASGCAPRADWIEGTLVTTDVSGVWRGSYVAGVSSNWLAFGEVEMTLRQRGEKVTGEGRFRDTNVTLEGTVRGDVFSFNDRTGRIRGQATVTGDEMSGHGRMGYGPNPQMTLKAQRQP